MGGYFSTDYLYNYLIGSMEIDETVLNEVAKKYAEQIQTLEDALIWPRRVFWSAHVVAIVIAVLLENHLHKTVSYVRGLVYYAVIYSYLSVLATNYSIVTISDLLKVAAADLKKRTEEHKNGGI